MIKTMYITTNYSVAYHGACVFTTEETDRLMLKGNIPTHSKLESGGERKRE